MSAMNAPVLAAFAPGVLVAGRMVSAISSNRAICSMVNSPGVPLAALAFSAAANRPLPPVKAVAPNQALTHRMASRRLSSGTGSSSTDMLMEASKVAAIEFIDGEVRRPRGERHVGQRGILACGRGHARPVGHE